MKRSKDWNKAKYKRFIKEKRGKGDLSAYKPWLTIQDMPSLGRVTRIYSYKTKRIHHFFSDIQTRYFYLLEWEDKVIDIKEHYPILDLRETLNDEDLDLDKYKGDDGTDYVFTTTFLITIRNNNKRYVVARDIKASHELERKNIIEKYEIERRYWKKKNIEWGIVTNKEISKVKAKNIEFVYPALELDENDVISWEEKEYLCQLLLKKIQKNKHQKVIKTIKNMELELGLEEGTALIIFKYLIIKKIIHLNMENKINLNLSAEKLIISIDVKRGEIRYATKG